MNDLIVRPLSYDEQLERSKDMMKELLSLPVIRIDHFKQLRDLQDTLKDRIKKKREEEKKK